MVLTFNTKENVGTWRFHVIYLSGSEPTSKFIGDEFPEKIKAKGHEALNFVGEKHERKARQPNEERNEKEKHSLRPNRGY